MLYSVKYAAKLVHTKRARSSTVIDSHQEPVSGQACDPLDPHQSFLILLVEYFYLLFISRWNVVCQLTHAVPSQLHTARIGDASTGSPYICSQGRGCKHNEREKTLQ